jgi:hypothetical protein
MTGAAYGEAMSSEPACTSKLTLHHGPDSPTATIPGPSDITDADDEQLRLLKHRLAQPVSTSLLTDAELEHISVHWDQDKTSGETWVRVLACGEVFQDWLTSPTWGGSDSADAGTGADGELQSIDLQLCAARLSDHLLDWIAESRFGWGQQRTARYTLPA